MNKNYVTTAKAKEILKVSKTTLQRWEKQGKIKAIRADGKFTHRRYDLSDILKESSRRGEETICRRKGKDRYICYCRVSSRDQQEDLERQKQYLRERYPNHQIVTDIGSGLNFKRKGFKTILDFSINGNLKELVVTHKDRLCRFGFEILEHFFTKLSDTTIVVLDKTSTTPSEELAEDLLSITTVFSSRLYGMRKGKHTTKIPEASIDINL